MPIPNSIAARAESLRAWRRDFHTHPELGYEERRTAGLVAKRLREFGCDQVVEGIGKTGVVGVIHGRNGPGDKARSILLRADMDALPMTEASGVEHASTTPGAMHACGHDGHTTMLLAAAEHLAETRAFDGTVVLVFQPAEEMGAGAKAMLADGLLDRFPCRAAFALHAMPGLEIGRFATRPGPFCGANEDFEIAFVAAGGHAAYPQDTADVLLAAAHFVTAAHGLARRQTDPSEPLVISVTSIQGGDGFNVLPDRARVRGTVRCYDAEVIKGAVDRIAAAATGVAATAGVEAQIWFDPDAYPPTINDPAETDFARSVAADIVGAEAIEETKPTLGVEDFAFIAREIPGAYLCIGNGDSAPLHHPAFDFDDRATAYGAAYFVRLIERGLPLAP